MVYENGIFEIARRLEQTALWFDPKVLIFLGLAAVMCGLFVWLGGLGFKRALIAFTGAVSGGICGFFISGRNILPVMISAGVVMAAAVIFERIFIAILTGILAASICFAIFARPYIENEESLKGYPEYKTEKMKVFLNTPESMKVAKDYMVDFAAEIKRIFSEMPIYKWAIMAALMVFFVATGFYRQRVTSAFCCAAVGTILIFSGMSLLLLYKGAAPISRIFQNQIYYQSVFGVMTAFGMIEQLLLCPLMKRKQKRKEKEEKPGGWRSI